MMTASKAGDNNAGATAKNNHSTATSMAKSLANKFIVLVLVLALVIFGMFLVKNYEPSQVQQQQEQQQQQQQQQQGFDSSTSVDENDTTTSQEGEEDNVMFINENTDCEIKSIINGRCPGFQGMYVPAVFATRHTNDLILNDHAANKIPSLLSFFDV